MITRRAVLSGAAGLLPAAYAQQPAQTLPASWEWDRSIKDFASLKANVLRFFENNPNVKSKANHLGLLTILGDIEEFRRTATYEFLDEQAPNGWLRTLDSLTIRGEAWRPWQEMLIRQRERMGQCIAVKRIPKYRLRFLDGLMTGPSAMTTWLVSQDWRNPWHVGNVDMDTAFSLAFEWKVMGNAKAHSALIAWFDWHDKHVDPKTGFWDPSRTGDVLRQMAGGMHQFAIYFLLGKKVPNAMAALNATLKLQQPTGLFSPDTYSQHGLDMDAVFVIANLHHGYGGREKQVRAALERAFEANLKCFVPQGGGVSRAGIDRMPDAWSTWCRVAVTGWCARVLGIKEFEGPWDFRHRSPFLSADGGAGVPDWLDDKWYDVVDWPRPQSSSHAGACG